MDSICLKYHFLASPINSVWNGSFPLDLSARCVCERENIPAAWEIAGSNEPPQGQIVNNPGIQWKYLPTVQHMVLEN